MQPQDSTTAEEWRRVPDAGESLHEQYEIFYEASNLGRVRSVRQCLLRPDVNLQGYKQVVLFCNGQRRKVRLNRLIATVFLGIPPDRMEANHRNGIKGDNRVTNLEWVTSSGNKHHAYATGLKRGSHAPRPTCRGERHPMAKLSEVTIRAIRAARGHRTQRALAQEYGITQAQIGRIQRYVNWKHVPLAS